jgi:hypothetical protein
MRGPTNFVRDLSCAAIFLNDTRDLCMFAAGQPAGDKVSDVLAGDDTKLRWHVSLLFAAKKRGKPFKTFIKKKRVRTQRIYCYLNDLCLLYTLRYLLYLYILHRRRHVCAFQLMWNKRA